MIEAIRGIAKQQEKWVHEQLGTKPGDINSREDLKGLTFKCGECKETKSATEAMIVQLIPGLPDTDLLYMLSKGVLTTRIRLICIECSKEYEE